MRTLARPRDAEEIRDRLRALRRESAGRWGRMSAHQMVCHLSDSFRMLLQERTVSHRSSLLQRTVVKWIALYAPLRWPHGIATRPEVDQEAAGTAPEEFAADVAALERLLARVGSPTLRFEGRLHPILGRMSHREWLRWAYLHVDHHLRQFGG